MQSEPCARALIIGVACSPSDVEVNEEETRGNIRLGRQDSMIASDFPSALSLLAS